ncbi:MAG: hypothetical protein ACI89U_002723 [Gammaproteobacteria bacterium]
MSAIDKLEALMKLELDLKAQYEKKMTAERYKLEESIVSQTKLQATVVDQAAQISDLKARGSESKRLEQEIREINNRAEKLKLEGDAQRKKTKLALKELNELKTIVKNLKQLDAEKLKKNLVNTKKKLEEQRTANTLLSKNIKNYKQENHDHLNTIAKLEAELEELKPEEEVENEATDVEAVTEADSADTKVEPAEEAETVKG